MSHSSFHDGFIKFTVISSFKELLVSMVVTLLVSLEHLKSLQLVTCAQLSLV